MKAWRLLSLLIAASTIMVFRADLVAANCFPFGGGVWICNEELSPEYCDWTLQQDMEEDCQNMCQNEGFGEGGFVADCNDGEGDVLTCFCP